MRILITSLPLLVVLLASTASKASSSQASSSSSGRPSSERESARLISPSTSARSSHVVRIDVDHKHAANALAAVTPPTHAELAEQYGRKADEYKRKAEVGRKATMLGAGVSATATLAAAAGGIMTHGALLPFAAKFSVFCGSMLCATKGSDAVEDHFTQQHDRARFEQSRHDALAHGRTPPKIYELKRWGER